MECTGGSPRKYVVKKPLKPGEIVKKGQYFRIEYSGEQGIFDDDTVKLLCDTASQVLCQNVGGLHMTYYHITNTGYEFEYQAMQDYEIAHAEITYLLQPIWEAYKIPIIIGIVALGGIAGFMMFRKR
jgi:hypothetical protein